MDRVKFSEKEMIHTGTYKPFFIEYPEYDYPVTPRENYLAYLRGEVPLWIPRFTDEQMFNPSIIPDNIARADVCERDVPSQKGGVDMFGISWDYIQQVGGSMVRPGMPALQDVNDWKKVIVFPDVDSWDWDACIRRNKGYINKKYLTTSTIFSGFFERLISFMDFSEAAQALIDEDQTDAIHELFDALADTYIKIIRHLKEGFDIDKVYLHDDWGAQRSPLFSMDVGRTMIVPYIRKVADYCHSIGVYFDFHSCGKIDTMVPLMIEAHIDEWCGQEINNFEEIVPKYADKIHLGIRFPALKDPTYQQLQERCDYFEKSYMKDYATHPVALMDFFMQPDEREMYYRMSRASLSGKQ